MADSDLLLKDQSATPAAFAPESTDVGTNTAGTIVKRSMFGSKDGAQVTLGAKGDAVWDGSAASASLISIMKAGVARLLGIGGSTVAVSGTVALSGGNATAVKVDGSGVTQPVSMQSPPTGAALDSSLVAILNAIKAQIDIAPLFVTDGTHYYVRREQVIEGTQAITVVFENIDGTAATPASVSALTPIVASGSTGGTASTRYVEQTLFDVTTGATGYAVGDVIARAVFYDTSTSSVVASAWLNLTQGTTLSGAPTAANLREQTQNIAVTSSVLPTGAATAAGVAAVVTALAGLLTADTVVKGTATDRGVILPVQAVSAAIGAGGSGAAVGDVLTLVGGTFTTPAQFTVSAVTSGAPTAVTLKTAGSYTVLPSLPAATTSSGAGTGTTLTPTFAGLAVQIAAANASRRGLEFQPQGGLAFVNGTATATADFHSLKLPADTEYETPPHRVGTGAITAIAGGSLPVPLYAREF